MIYSQDSIIMNSGNRAEYHSNIGSPTSLLNSGLSWQVFNCYGQGKATEEGDDDDNGEIESSSLYKIEPHDPSRSAD